MLKIENNLMHNTGRATYIETDKRNKFIFTRKQGLMTLREFSWAMRRKSNPVVESELKKKLA